MKRSFISTIILAAALAGCSSVPRELDLSLDHSTAQGRYAVRLRPPAVPPAINQIHAWQVEVRSADGKPVHGARIDVDGGMPQHGHGLPTRPRVTREIADGTYLLEGMKFSMTGWWEIRLAIDAAGGADKAVFNTMVNVPSVAEVAQR